MLKSWRLTVAWAALAMGCVAADRKAEEVAAAVDKKYNAMSSLRMEFEEIYTGAGRTRSETGTLWLKRPGRMRWEYKAPREKLFLTDGKNAIFYVPGERQARKTSLKHLDDLRSPLAFLLGKIKVRKELKDIRLADAVAARNPQNTVISGVPRRLQDRVERVMLEVNPAAQIERLIIEELDGTVTEFRFRAIAEALPIADSDFRFRPPPGVEMIEGKQWDGV
jgi:outer membrane lipoprotein carrier protein